MMMGFRARTRYWKLQCAEALVRAMRASGCTALCIYMRKIPIQTLPLLFSSGMGYRSHSAVQDFDNRSDIKAAPAIIIRKVNIPGWK